MKKWLPFCKAFFWEEREMYHYSLPQWLFFFYFYCFFGWCFESTYVSICERRLVNRGFLRGPFLPLYGSGAIMMLVVSSPFQDSLPLVFLAGCVGSTVLEYVTGVVMEALFKVRYWDYSHKKLNFKGYICLESTIAWGFLTIVMTEWLHKPVEYFVLGIPEAVLSAVVTVFTVMLSADFALSFKAALDLRDVLAKMEDTKKELMHIRRRLDVIIALAGEDLSAKKEELLEDWKNLGFEEIRQGIEERLEKVRGAVSAYAGTVHFPAREETDRLETSRLEAGRAEPGRVESGRLETDRAEAGRLETGREELLDLLTQYRRSIAERASLKGIRDFFQRGLIRSNPSMSSRKYGEALEELKDSVRKHKGKKES